MCRPRRQSRGKALSTREVPLGICMLQPRKGPNAGSHARPEELRLPLPWPSECAAHIGNSTAVTFRGMKWSGIQRHSACCTVLVADCKRMEYSHRDQGVMIQGL